ncbi:MAG: DUF6512 family protein [Oliverpabstia sp.]
MKQLKYYTIAGTVFVLVLGSLSHFFYEWSNYNFIIGLFSPVNESVWEHMKLVFFPMLLYSAISLPKLRNKYPCISSALLSGILIGTLLIPIIFYIYTGLLGNHYLFLDIATFIVSVIIGFIAVYRLNLSCKFKKYTWLLWILTGIFLILFFILSYPHVII